MSKMALSAFADELISMMPIMMREFIRHQSGEFHKTRITMPQFGVMDILSRRGESRMTDLADYLRVTTAAMTGIIDRLVKEGFAEREHDSKDRRTVIVRLTAKGARIVHDMNAKRKEITMKIFGLISQEERDQYLKIVGHINHHILKQQAKG